MGVSPGRFVFPAQWRAGLVAAVAAGCLGLGLGRALAEWNPVSLAWLASPTGALFAAAGIASVVGLVSIRWGRDSTFRQIDAALLPLFLSAVYVLGDPVDKWQAMVWLGGGVLLALTVVATVLMPGTRTAAVTPVVVLAGSVLAVFLATVGRTVGQADTFEFQVVAPKLGIAHPTGYPLYLLLAKVFSLLPLGEMALRINLLSAVCATGAVVAVHGILRRLGCPPVPSVLAAWCLAFSAAFWSQAVVAEVYALNAFLVMMVLLGLVGVVGRSAAGHPVGPALEPTKWRTEWFAVRMVFLALGLGFANHLTTIVLVPAAVLAFWWARPRLSGRQWASAGLLSALGLLLYLYLPIRWPAIHDGQWMTWREFLQWTTGLQFKGALRLDAWYADSSRYGMVGNLVLHQFGWLGVLTAVLGAGWLGLRRRRIALVTLLVWLGYALYGLVYYVPDIEVFLIPAYLIMSIWIGCGMAALVGWWSGRRGGSAAAYRAVILTTLLAVLPLRLVATGWATADRSTPNPLDDWGRYVLSLDLEPGAAILADSEKVAPLYYLQQTAGLRPDLVIMVLPDEAAYRSELQTRLATGQTVYLARFLPGLEGVYHLTSAGPLVRVDQEALRSLPIMDAPLDTRFGPHVTLLGYDLDSRALAYPDAFRLTLFWTADDPVDSSYQVHLRLVDAAGSVPWSSEGAHPVGNSYPMNAWHPDEVIADWHEISIPLQLNPGEYQVQIGLFAPFSNVALMPTWATEPWVTVTTLQVRSPSSIPTPSHQRRIWLNGGAILGADVASSTRPAAELPVTVYYSGAAPASVWLGWEGAATERVQLETPVTGLSITAPETPGSYHLAISAVGPMRCRWMSTLAGQCRLAKISVQGFAVPSGATNFQDLLVLLNLDVGDGSVVPGAKLEANLTWQALGPLAEDYTLFLHLLDPADRIVGQVDTWPVHGTMPTSRWPVGQRITDRIEIPVASDAGDGPFRLEVGWYLLRTMQRLKVLDVSGRAVDDRFLVVGLTSP